MSERVRDGDDQRGTAGGEPERTCIVTRAKGHPDSLIRFALGPEDTIYPDLAGRLPGRGVWVACSRERVAAAAKGGAFARSLKRKVRVPDDLAGLVDSLLAQRCIEALSLANKAGLVVPGFTKVETSIAQGEAFALVHAREAADDGAGKLDRRLKAVQLEMGRGPDVRIVRELTVGELSLAMGRPHVVHAALRSGGAAQNFLKEAGRLRTYRASGGAGTAEPSELRSDTERA